MASAGIQASSSSSSSSSSTKLPAYATKDSKWVTVKKWEDDLLAEDASKKRTVVWIKYKKLATGVNHEYLLFDISDSTLFVTERNNEKPADYVMSKAQEANTLLATLTPSSTSTLPERTFARVLVLVSEKAPTYSWKTNNCYWYAGSVYETIRVGLKDVVEKKTDDFKHRGKYKLLWWFTVGTGPETVTIPSAKAPAGVDPNEQPYDKVMQDFGREENFNAYKLVHEKNVGPLQVIFEDPMEENLTIALRGLVGFILRHLAGPLQPGEKLEDLPMLEEWLRQDRIALGA